MDYNTESHKCKYFLYIMLNIFDGCVFGLYTLFDENIGQVFYTATDWYFYNVADDINWTGMDGPDYVYDEILNQLRCPA